MNLTKILVTGSAGLIGSLLTKKLTTAGVQVVELDSKLPTHAPGYGDVRNVARITELAAGCQGIVHLAAVSRVIWGEQNQALCWAVNVEGTRNILEAADNLSQRPWVIFASSREVYGQQNIFPVTEEASVAPLNVYARSKVAAEKLVSEYRQRLPTAILRFSSVYGSVYDYANRVVPAFCLAALQNNLARVEGFNNIFDFTHVTDTVDGILLAIQQLQTGEDYLPPIHLTTGLGTSLLQLIQLIEQTLNRPVNYQAAPIRTYDVLNFYGNPERAQKILGWQPQVNLAQGIKNLLAEYAQHLSRG